MRKNSNTNSSRYHSHIHSGRQKLRRRRQWWEGMMLQMEKVSFIISFAAAIVVGLFPMANAFSPITVIRRPHPSSPDPQTSTKRIIINTQERKASSSSSSTSSSVLSSSLSNDEISRYSRHLVLNDVGMNGQLGLKNSAVLVVGAGGLGSPCLLYLAAAGVGHIGIVDNDVVDESNLQRQIIHSINTVGKSKCQSAMSRIQDINPYVNVKLYQEEFTSETALRIVNDGFANDKPYDVVIDGSDNFPTKYLINDVCSIVGVPWVYSAILAFEGQLSVFNVREDDNGNRGPDYRDLLPTPPPPGDVPSCAEGGVLGVLPGTMGCLQATECIKIILGHMDGLLSGRVLVFDAIKMKFNEIGLAKTPNRQPITSLIDYKGFCGGPKQQTPPTGEEPGGGRTVDEVETVTTGAEDLPSFRSIDPKGCLERMVDGWSPWVLDVRLQTENDIVALPFTDRVVPHRAVRVQDIPKTGDVLVYCKAGVRGKKACTKLINDYNVDPNRLYNLDGGIMRWQKDIDPSLPQY